MIIIDARVDNKIPVEIKKKADAKWKIEALTNEFSISELNGIGELETMPFLL